MFSSIRFCGYKSFSSKEETEIPQMGYLNLFIGKNNSGKSSALDIVGAAFSSRAHSLLPIKPPIIYRGYRIDSSSIKAAFATPQYRFYNIEKSASEYIGQHFWVEAKLRSSNTPAFGFNFDKKINPTLGDNISWHDFYNALKIEDYCYQRIAAERNIVPEISSQNSLQPDGTGATNLIRRIINHKHYDEDLIEVELLTALNQIMGPDAHFDSIRVQEIQGLREDSEIRWQCH